MCTHTHTSFSLFKSPRTDNPLQLYGYSLLLFDIKNSWKCHGFPFFFLPWEANEQASKQASDSLVKAKADEPRSVLVGTRNGTYGIGSGLYLCCQVAPKGQEREEKRRKTSPRSNDPRFVSTWNDNDKNVLPSFPLVCLLTHSLIHSFTHVCMNMYAPAGEREEKLLSTTPKTKQGLSGNVSARSFSDCPSSLEFSEEVHTSIPYIYIIIIILLASTAGYIRISRVTKKIADNS